MKKEKILATISLITFLLFSGCGVNVSTDNANYSTVSSVNGITFDVYGNILKGASFTSAISDTELLNNAQTFVYRNEIDEYLIYNSTTYAIICQRIKPIGIDSMSSAEIKAFFSTFSFLKTSITSSEKKISFQKGNSNKATKLYFENIEAGVSPNVYSYQNYYGALSYLETSDYGFVLFMGVTKPLQDVTKEVKRIIEHTVKTLTYTGMIEEASDEEDYFEVNSIPLSAETSVENELVQNEHNQDDNNLINVEVKESTENVPAETTNVEDLFLTGIQESETTPLPKFPDNSFEKQANTGINPQSGSEPLVSLICTGYSKNPIGTDVEIRVFGINSKADEIISEDVPSFDIKTGMHIEYIDYNINSLDESFSDVVTAINIKGLDKESLTYMGIRYSQKTYSYIKGDYIRCFYEVPNGCNEYLLEFGNIAGTTSILHVIDGEIENR